MAVVGVGVGGLDVWWEWGHGWWAVGGAGEFRAGLFTNDVGPAVQRNPSDGATATLRGTDRADGVDRSEITQRFDL